MTTSNTHFDFFENKKHYLAFRKAWANIHHSNELTGAHHLMYNILRGKPTSNGFTFKTSSRKIENGGIINDGVVKANRQLNHLISAAADNVMGNEARKTNAIEKYYHLNKILTQFDGHLTIEMLAKIELTESDAEPLFHNYGKGMQLANLIRNGEVLSMEEWYERVAA